MIFKALNQILLIFSGLHCLCNILVHSPPLSIFKVAGEISKNKISFKGDGDGRDGNDAKNFASIFCCKYNNPVDIFSLLLLAHAYHVVFHLVKKNPLLDVTVVFLM